MHLVIDIGNSLTKVALFEHRSLISLQATETFSPAQLEKQLANNNISHSTISSVNAEINELENILQNKTTYYHFNMEINMGIKNHYHPPDTLGNDRYAAIIGAKSLYPEQNLLIIDAGTCITFDMLDNQGTYLGGCISPGITMRYRAMNAFTKLLPLIQINPNFQDILSTNTKNAMTAGVQGGVVYEALGFITQFYYQHQNLKVILCGGNTNFFDERLKNSIFGPSIHACPHLVLIGLNEVICHYNDSIYHN